MCYTGLVGEGENKIPGVIVKHVLCPLSMVHIPIYDQDPVKIVYKLYSSLQLLHTTVSTQKCYSLLSVLHN